MSINSIITVAFSGITATAASVANVDMPEDAEIVAISSRISDNTLLTTESIRTQLSFLSSSQIDTNDARGVIFETQLTAGTLQTNGFIRGDANHAISLPDGIPVNAGERIHMHVNVTGTPNGSATFILYLRTKGGGRRSVRRR